MLYIIDTCTNDSNHCLTPQIMVSHQDLHLFPRLGISVTTQGGSGRQYVTGLGRNPSKYRFVLLNVYRFWET